MKLCFFVLLILLSFQSCSENTESASSEKLFIENENLMVHISSLGAELQKIIQKKSGKEFLWQGDTTYWGGRSPVMFPVNVRFRENRFTYREKSYEMPRMGLAVQENFRPRPGSSSEACMLEMTSSPETLLHYPFSFRLQISYILDGNRLINQFRIENQGPDTMYFALGGHPGFRFPFEDQDRASYAYTFTDILTVSRIEIAESLVQDKVLPFLSGENQLSLSDDRIPANGSGMFIKDVPTKRIGLGRVGQSPFVEVELRDFPNVNLWSPPGMPYACIEPMLSHHDLADAAEAIEDKDHLIALAGGKSQTYEYSIIIH